MSLERWLPRLLLLSVLAAAVPVGLWIGLTAIGRGPNYNDFHDYWLASKLILQGHSPYDIEALRQLANREGLEFVVGTGYSYPLPFAVATIPLAALPVVAAVLVFNAISLVAFGLAVGVWLLWAFPFSSPRTLSLVALGAGAFPAVYGSVANGQANLLVLAVSAVGLMAVLERGSGRELLGGIAIGLGAVVKLVPAAVVVPFGLGSRWLAIVGVLVGLFGTIAAATVTLPFAAAGSTGLADLLGPDSYFTNQSINAFVSRLVRDSDRTIAVFPGAFDPFVVSAVLTGLFGLATAVVLWRARGAIAERRELALAVAFTLVAATIAAPKNQFWSHTLLLIPIGLLLAVEAPDLRFGRFDRLDRVAIGLWLLGAIVFFLMWQEPPPKVSSIQPIVTFGHSAALYGTLALWALFARRTWRLGAGRLPAVSSDSR